LVAALVLAPVAALLLRAETGTSAVIWPAIRFTLLQASLSALISVALAVPLAKALARRAFFGREFMLSLLGAPFLLPSIVAVLGLLAIWGRSGVFSAMLAPFGLGPLDIYGLNGVLLAHVFFNLPLATRMLLQGWQAVPSEHFRLAAQLNLAPRARFVLFDMPVLRGAAPSALLVIFMLCMSSFAVVLALGGGPKASTIELAIYQALRFEFDLSTAAQLAMVQLAIGLVAAALAFKFGKATRFGGGLGAAFENRDRRRGPKLLDSTVLLLAAGFVGLPMLAILLKGLGGLAALPAGTGAAFAVSLGVAAASTLLALGLALALAQFIETSPRGRLIELSALLLLATSPFVIGTGLFIIINPFASPFALALPITALVNAALALPLMLRIIRPALSRVQQDYGPLSQGLGLQGWARFRLVTFPQIRPELGFATGLAAALSMGDLGVITLFAPPDTQTLPLLMYRLMGSYRMDAAAAVALVLVLSSFGLFYLFDKGGRNADA
jgi:thiamine transport system permease protein